MFWFVEIVIGILETDKAVVEKLSAFNSLYTVGSSYEGLFRFLLPLYKQTNKSQNEDIKMAYK